MDEVIHMTTQHDFVVTWERNFSGHPTKLRLVQRREGMLSSVDLEWDFGDKFIIRECPIDVMRKIVALYDALPPLAQGGGTR
jgi:hypothetical protein